MKRSIAFLVVLTLASLASACGPRTGAGSTGRAAPGEFGGSAAEDDRSVANFYQGKTVRFVVGFAPGGGFDTYTRAIARHIGKHIPGNPAIIVDNMTGGGSLTAANYVYGGTRPDGLTIGNWIGPMILQQILGGEGVEFDPLKYKYIGAPTPDTLVCAVRKDSGIRSLTDLITSQQPVILGGSAPGSSTDDTPKVLAAALGFNLRLVSGYSGTATIRQAADNGEVQGGCWAWESIKVTWKAAIESGEALVIGQAVDKKHPDLPNVENALDLAKTEEARQLLRAGVLIPGVITRLYAVHPDIPPARLQALRQAFLATLKDPEFLAEAQTARLDVDPIPGEEIERLVGELFALPDSMKARLKSVLVGP